MVIIFRSETLLRAIAT
jgi:micrococcal nuclease